MNHLQTTTPTTSTTSKTSTIHTIDMIDTMESTDSSLCPLGKLHNIPPELLDLVLLWSARLEGNRKNKFLERRLVCKAFDKAIRPLVLKAIQLEASMFKRSAIKPQIQSLEAMGDICEALYLDMMIVRDEEEANSLVNAFRGLSHASIPEMESLFAQFRQYCMGEHTFDETDLRSNLEDVIERTPNLKRFRMNLPVQVVGNLSSTATLLLATTLSILANRPEEHIPLETIVIDHLTDTTLNRLCYNHMDLKNCLRVFAHLKHIALSLKKNESALGRIAFTNNLWFLLHQADSLESLCLVGWSSSTKRNATLRRLQRAPATYPEWTIQCLEYTLGDNTPFQKLRYLELKRVDMMPKTLINIISEASHSLKEIYLIEVYLKICSRVEGTEVSLWIGELGKEKDKGACWVAQSLRHMKYLKLDILRATGLGYDDFAPPDDTSPYPDYDLVDPTPFSRSFDQRFVEAVMGVTSSGDRPVLHWPTTSNLSLNAKVEYDAELYQLIVNDPTSTYKLNIDGLFMNHNDKAMKELSIFMSIADRIMCLITGWIERARMTTVDEMGALNPGPLPSNAPPNVVPAPASLIITNPLPETVASTDMNQPAPDQSPP